jgi:hypothetical protein
MFQTLSSVAAGVAATSEVDIDALPAEPGPFSEPLAEPGPFSEPLSVGSAPGATGNAAVLAACPGTASRD